MAIIGLDSIGTWDKEVKKALKNYHNVEMKIRSKSYSGINNCYSKPRKSTKLNYEGDVYQSD